MRTAAPPYSWTRLRALKPSGVRRVVDLAEEAALSGRALAAIASGRASGASIDYASVIAERRILPPVDHPEPSRLHVTGTGLTHLGSAATRDRMHQAGAAGEKPTDSMVMFRWGLEGGRPEPRRVGAQPVWFYKGNGRTVVAPEAPLRRPSFAEDGGEEPELALAYWIGPDGTPAALSRSTRSALL